MGIKVQGYEFDTVEDVKKAVDAGLIQKHDVTQTSPNMQVPHGIAFDQNIGGLFTRPGADPDMFSTIVQPTGARFLAELFLRTTIETNPEYDVLTGVKALEGSPAANGCSPAPKAGDAKLGTFRSGFGEAYIETEQGQINKMGGRINLADTDRRLVNLAGMGNPLMPEPLQMAQNINTPLGLSYMKMYVTMLREWMRVLFTGNYGSASGIFTKEFNGFDNLIIENPVDVEGNTIQAASAKVINWNNVSASGLNGSYNLVDYIAGLMHYVERLSEDTELPMQGVITIDPDLFWVITQFWPCSYLTNQCATDDSGGQRVIVTGGEQTTMRDDMRREGFLWVNGKRIPVVPTTAITKTAFGPGFSSSISYIPLYALGRKVTYIEGFNQWNTDVQQFVQAGNVLYRAYNNGLYAIAPLQTRFCVENMLGFQPRLIMRTPWLAWRIQNVNFTMPGFLYARDANPSGPYHANGGRYFNNPPYYNPNSI